MRYLILIAVLPLLLTACTPTDGFDGGHPISKEDLESLSAELFTEESDPVETRPPYTDREPNTYYWTENSRVYHRYRDCVHLKNAKQIESGSLISAKAAGLDTPCSSCSGS